MTESKNQRVWFITGSSTGFGRDLAERALRRGDKVVATARKPEQIAELADEFPQTALVLPLDVTSAASIENAVVGAITKFGRVDVLVNNAGYGLAGAIEEATEAEYMPVFETNVFGLIRLTRAVLPYLRAQKSGHVVNLSSIGGLIGSPGWGFYNASKFAVEGFSEALAAELKPLGIAVTIIEPGPFRTDFLGRSGVEAEARIPDYDPTAGKTREYFHDQAGKQPGDPAKAVQAILDVVGAEKPPLHLLLGKIALTRFRTRLDGWKQELDQWESLTIGADFPEGE
ncbi:oxidoreductase [Granulicella sibirica]|uniref:Dehydrogenases with different specificities (Related to short-chain alcohol dehydrogenases) n=1 Tax=Granulicella sibirica TaxID=2479048 RepID=A0A4Q0T760_9BACT|nr:oxidoreductase [Granulicella sibirica]RXH57948.1 Dehydrogenases with different specificities (related to short-chain alcohol dehydrogenases) [Granulicella sibirica]